MDCCLGKYLPYVYTEEGNGGYCICAKVMLDCLQKKIKCLFLKETLGHCSCKGGTLYKKEPGAG